MKDRLGTKPLVEGALLAAVAAVLALFGYYLPLVGPAILFLWPVPIILIHVRHGLKASILTVLVSALTLAALIGPLEALALSLSPGLVGIAFGVAFARRMEPMAAVLLGAVALALSLALTAALAFAVMGINPITEQINLLREAQETTTAIYQRLGVGEEYVTQTARMGETIILMFQRLFPALLAAAALFHSFLNFKLARLVLRRLRLGQEMKDFPPFERWSFPRQWIVAFAGGMVLAALTPYHRSPSLEAIGLNVYFLASFLFVVQGLAVAYYYLGRLRLAKPVRVLITVYALLVPFVMQVLPIVGMFDALFNYRRL